MGAKGIQNGLKQQSQLQNYKKLQSHMEAEPKRVTTLPSRLLLNVVFVSCL